MEIPGTPPLPVGDYKVRVGRVENRPEGVQIVYIITEGEHKGRSLTLTYDHYTGKGVKIQEDNNEEFGLTERRP